MPNFFSKVDIFNLLKSLREQYQRERKSDDVPPLEEGDYATLFDVATMFGLSKEQVEQVIGDEGKRLLM